VGGGEIEEKYFRHDEQNCMTLRRREYLAEAAYWRDKEKRRMAEDFYDSLVFFLKTKSNQMDFDPQTGSFAVLSNVFWNNHDIENFAVLFTPSEQINKEWGSRGGLGHAGNLKVLVFPILIAPGDNRRLGTRLKKDTVIHEVIHLLDAGTGKSGITKYGKMGSGSTNFDPGVYFNEPGEWNAYWQEGAADFERMTNHDLVRKNPNAFEHFFGDGSLKQALERVDKFWDKEFIKNMNTTTRRKFEKRFAELWEKAKDKKLL
jgi:hypothetical protein